MSIPVSPYFTITKANGNDVVKFPDNRFRFFLKHSFNVCYYSAVGRAVYGLAHNVDAQQKEEYDRCFMSVTATATMLLKVMRNEFCGDHAAIKEVSEFDWEEEGEAPEWNDRSYPNDQKIGLLNNQIGNSQNEAEKAKLQEEIASLEVESQAMFKDFVALVKYLMSYYVEYIQGLITKFDADLPLSFGEMYTVLSESKSTKFVINVEDVDIISSVCDVEIAQTMFGQYMRYKHNVTSFNSKFYVKQTASRSIADYDGAVSPSKLGISSAVNTNIQAIKDRAAKYGRLSEAPAYQYHTGHMTQRNGWFSYDFPATGRCMVDLKTLSQLEPNFSDYYPYSLKDSLRENAQDPITKFSQLTEDMILSMSPCLYVFSFIAKRWARVNINDISDIQFRADAFDKLIIDADTKDLMFSLVDQSKGGGLTGQDIIDNKGGGSIFLLAGKPGIGKTITAETMAETLKRPLYMVGVGELGTDAKALESNLTRVLNTASAWNAILLLDECDIFMEERQNMDVHRNAMVGVFLRLLEYYPGILFLTTNRASNIDAAFFSRISLAIQYPDLDSAKRFTIWTNILALYKDNIDLSTIDVKTLSHLDINGRQIKNAVRLAVTYCNYKNKKPTTEDFASIVEKSLKFIEHK